MSNTNIPATLLLEDGTAFHGLAAGAPGTTVGEICFNTGMTGYQEIFTDPSYFGQVLVATHEHIGNYGINEEEVESESVKIAGLVCRNFNNFYARKLATRSLQEYFEQEKKMALYGVDTRAIVRHVRSKGAMNCIISSEIADLPTLQQELRKAPSMAGLELSSKVSTTTEYFVGDENAPLRIAVLDLGVKKNILRCFAERGVYLKVFPAKTTFAAMQQWKPDGYFISNGPGDPAVMDYAIQTVREILEASLPMFGICLGHQILAQANGISTYKMHHGHRGLNHPVKNIISGRCEITSQNHGFAVSEKEILSAKNAEVTHINLNDDTIEGMRLTDRPAFSVQYHPESSPGPHDSRYLFDDFLALIKGR